MTWKFRNMSSTHGGKEKKMAHIPSLLAAENPNCWPSLTLVFSPPGGTHTRTGWTGARSYSSVLRLWRPMTCSPAPIGSVWGTLAQLLLPCGCPMSFRYDLEHSVSARSLAWDWITGLSDQDGLCQGCVGYDGAGQRAFLPLQRRWFCVSSAAPDSQHLQSTEKSFPLGLRSCFVSPGSFSGIRVRPLEPQLISGSLGPSRDFSIGFWWGHHPLPRCPSAALGTRGFLNIGGILRPPACWTACPCWRDPDPFCCSAALWPAVAHARPVTWRRKRSVETFPKPHLLEPNSLDFGYTFTKTHLDGNFKNSGREFDVLEVE